MEDKDLELLSLVSRSLWSNNADSLSATQESLAAATLLQLSAIKTMDKTLGALKVRALRDGQSVNVAAMNNPFYRLSVEERLVVSSLHHGKLGYSRLAEILQTSESQIAQIAWSCRLRLAAAARVAHPTGSPYRGTYCPDYDSKNPWTQRLLDEQMEKSELLFLQKHLMACGHCRAALNSCRGLYFHVESLLPRNENQIREHVEALKEVINESEEYFQPSKRTSLYGLRTFLGHRDVQVVLALFSMATVWKFFF